MVVKKTVVQTPAGKRVVSTPVVSTPAGTRVATQQTIGNSTSQPGRVPVRRNPRRPQVVVDEPYAAREPKIDNNYLTRRIANLEAKIFGPDYVYHDAISQGQNENGDDAEYTTDDEGIVRDANGDPVDNVVLDENGNPIPATDVVTDENGNAILDDEGNTETTVEV